MPTPFLGSFRLHIALVLFVAVSAVAQKPPSAKDLVRQAEADEQAQRWEPAYNKYKLAAAQKPNDKKIQEAVTRVGDYLAQLTGTQATTACNQMELAKCEALVKQAQQFGNTERVREAQGTLEKVRKEATDGWARVQQLIASGNLDDAELELGNLGRHSYFLPGLAGEKQRVRQLRLTQALDNGRRLMQERKWEQAHESFSAALRIEPNNAEAIIGAENAKKEKDGEAAFTLASNTYQAKQYEKAWDALQKARAIFPQRQEYAQLERKVAFDWSAQLFADAVKQSENRDDLKQNQAALRNFLRARELDPNNKDVQEKLVEVRDVLSAIYVSRAAEREAVADGSRIGIAYAFYVGAQKTNPNPDFPYNAKLKNAEALFARKRAVQALIDVPNVSSAPRDYANRIQLRVQSALEQFQLTDLKIRPLADYKASEDDPQFMEARPAGKSPVTLVRVSINGYDWESPSKQVDKASRYVSGQEPVANPTYMKLEEEYKRKSTALTGQNVKPGKASKEGYTHAEVNLLQQQLATTPREIMRDKLTNYSYQEFHRAVRARVSVQLSVTDHLEKREVASEKLEAAQEQVAVEIASVHERDANGNMNKAARLQSSEELLQICTRNVDEQLQKKVPALMRVYLNRFYDEGEKALKEKRYEDALENFITHWVFSRGLMDARQAQVIRDNVEFQLGLDIRWLFPPMTVAASGS